MADDRLCVYVVGEDEVHRALAMALVHRLTAQLAEERGADWFDPRTALRWSALDERDTIPEARRWTDIHQEVAPAHRRRLMGHLHGRPIGPGAHKLRGKLVECVRAERPAALVVLFQDTDGDERLRQGSAQVLAWARSEPDLCPVAIANPNPEAEAWFIVGTQLDKAQRTRLAHAKKSLGFNPAHHPERLGSKPNQDKDAKRVVQFVLLGSAPSLAKAESKSPTHEEADGLAAALCDGADRRLPFEACGLGPFVQDLCNALGLLPPERLFQRPR